MESAVRRLQVQAQHLAEGGVEASDTAAASPPGTIEMVRPFDCDTLNEFLFPYHRDMRKVLIKKWHADELLQEPHFGLSIAQERDLTSRQMTRLMEMGKGYISVWDFARDPSLIAAWIQCYRLRNIATSTLFGVHLSLFGSSILFLGTDEQRAKYLPGVDDYSMPGCFALTELGHGSNVQAIETVATYDQASEHFIIRSPTITSQKYFIGGAAKNAKWAVVFAQLKMGERNEGVHAFILRLRDESGNIVPNIRIADCGHKMALNGVDNGRIMFDDLRVPRDQLLSRFGGVNKAGIYSSPINPAIKRFAHNIGALVFGRYVIALGAVSFTAVSVLTALRYAYSRRQFGEDGNERQLISYAAHQRRLLPHLATNYAIHFGNEYLLRLMCEKDNRKDKEIHVLASGLKAYASWSARNALQDCREACGGQGFLSDNLVGIFKSEIEIYTTFEGDNVLMYQQVAKFILTEARRKPPPEYSAPSEASRAKTEGKYLRSFEFIQNAMAARLHQHLPYVAERLMENVANGKPVMDAWNDCGAAILQLGIVYTERFIIERFVEAIGRCPDATQRHAMSLLLSLLGMFIIEKDTWFLKHQYISADQSEAITAELILIQKEIVPFSISLSEAFGFGDETLGPIGRDWVAHNKF
eukprot:gene3600-4124_t